MADTPAHFEAMGPAGTIPPRPGNGRPPARSRRRLPDIVVLTSGGLVALATGVALYAQLGGNWMLGTAGGLAVFIVVATLHVLMRRTEEIADLKATIARLESELAHPSEHAPAPAEVLGEELEADYWQGPQHTQAHEQAPVDLHEQFAEPPAPAPVYAQQPVHEQAQFQAPSPAEIARRIEAMRIEEGIEAPGARGAAPAEPAPVSQTTRTEAPPRAPAPQPRRSGGLTGAFSAVAGKLRGTDSGAPAAAKSKSAAKKSQPAARNTPVPQAVAANPRGPRVVSGWQGSTAHLARALGAAPPPDMTHRVEPELMAEPPSQPMQAPPAYQQAYAPRDYGYVTTHASEAAPQPAPQPAARYTHAAPPSQPAAYQEEAAPVRARSRPSPEIEAPAVIAMPPPPPDASAALQWPSEDSAARNPVDTMIEEIAARLAAERTGSGYPLALPSPSAFAHEGPDGAPLDPEEQAALDAAARVVRSAIEGSRVEVHLQPILALDGLATVSYEAFPRLKDADGSLIMPEEYEALAQATGLLPSIEKLALLRTIHVLQQLDQRGKLSPIFINVSRELLVDGSFFRDFLEAISGSRNLSTYLVLEFGQHAAADFGEAELESLETLARLGFTFALDGVASVEMDFESLIDRGLAFVKIPAKVFAIGLAAGETAVTTAEIRPLFEEPGLQVVVYDIADEADLDGALGQAIVYGQGSLFAEPMPIKADVLGEAA
jgi:cyclic-di-GMP phosphodiesterase TipF (flagellum assembly factor)